MLNSSVTLHRASPSGASHPVAQMAAQCRDLPAEAEIRSKQSGVFYVKGDPKRVSIISRRNRYRESGVEQLRTMWSQAMTRQAEAARPAPGSPEARGRTGADAVQWDTWQKQVWWPSFRDTYLPRKDGAHCMTVGALHAMNAQLQANSLMGGWGVPMEARSDGFQAIASQLTQIQRARDGKSRAEATQALESALTQWMRKAYPHRGDAEGVARIHGVPRGRDGKSDALRTPHVGSSTGASSSSSASGASSSASASSASRAAATPSAHEQEEARRRMEAHALAHAFTKAMTDTGSVPVGADS